MENAIKVSIFDIILLNISDIFLFVFKSSVYQVEFTVHIAYLLSKIVLILCKSR